MQDISAAPVSASATSSDSASQDVPDAGLTPEQIEFKKKYGRLPPPGLLGGRGRGRGGKRGGPRSLLGQVRFFLAQCVVFLLSACSILLFFLFSRLNRSNNIILDPNKTFSREKNAFTLIQQTMQWRHKVSKVLASLVKQASCMLQPLIFLVDLVLVLQHPQLPLPLPLHQLQL